jgi:hypothetical protein
LIKTLWDRVKENAVAAIATATIAICVSVGIFAWRAIIENIDKHIDNAILSSLDKSDSPLTQRIVSIFNASLIKSRADEVGEITSGDAQLNPSEPSHYFFVFAPRDNHWNLKVDVVWKYPTTAANVAIYVNGELVDVLKEDKEYTISEATLRNTKVSKSSDELPIAIPDKSKEFSNGYTVRFLLDPNTNQKDAAVDVKYLSIVTPYIKMGNADQVGSSE